MQSQTGWCNKLVKFRQERSQGGPKKKVEPSIEIQYLQTSYTSSGSIRDTSPRADGLTKKGWWDNEANTVQTFVYVQTGLFEIAIDKDNCSFHQKIKKTMLFASEIAVYRHKTVGSEQVWYSDMTQHGKTTRNDEFLFRCICVVWHCSEISCKLLIFIHTL